MTILVYEQVFNSDDGDFSEEVTIITNRATAAAALSALTQSVLWIDSMGNQVTLTESELEAMETGISDITKAVNT